MWPEKSSFVADFLSLGTSGETVSIEDNSHSRRGDELQKLPEFLAVSNGLLGRGEKSIGDRPTDGAGEVCVESGVRWLSKLKRFSYNCWFVSVTLISFSDVWK